MHLQRHDKAMRAVIAHSEACVAQGSSTRAHVLKPHFRMNATLKLSTAMCLRQLYNETITFK